MNFKSLFQRKPRKEQSIAREWLSSVTFAVVAATLIRWTAVEAYVIPTPSMEDSALVGDYLFVSKLHYGTRTTDTPLQLPLSHQKIWFTDIPSYVEWIKLPAYRLPGFSQVKNGEMVVFNVPRIEQNEGVQHPISLKSNYVKRCIGIPGDEVTIRDRQVYVNDKPLANPPGMKFSYLVTAKDEINKRNITRFGMSSDDYFYLGRTTNSEAYYRMLLTAEQAEVVKTQSYVTSFREDFTRNDGPEAGIFPPSMNNAWNGDNYGPLLLPSEGLTIPVNDSTMGIYGETIALYEHHERVDVQGGKLFIDGHETSEYTFKQGYYFMMGDNRHNSLDSRYWGFVPADHIVGKPIFVWMSIDNEADLLHKIRWRRLFSAIE